VRAFAAALALALVATAAADIAVPALTARVTDQTGTLSAGERATLEQALAEFERRKGSQIAVLVVPTTGDETIEQYAIRVAERWQLGRKGVDDGVLLLVAKDDRRLRIEVGYGLEGAIPDAVAKRIIEETIRPRFRDGDFYGGIRIGVEQLMRVADGEPLPEPSRARRGDGDKLQLLVVIGFVMLGVAQMLGAMIGEVKSSVAVSGIFGLISGSMLAAAGAGLAAGLILFLLALFVQLARHADGGGWSSGGGWGGSLGSGGFGGSSGGGFSGGGGGFGGGGASGGW
jgi:uncharacterized protein